MKQPPKNPQGRKAQETGSSEDSDRKKQLEFFREAAALAMKAASNDAETRPAVLQSLHGEDDIVLSFEVVMVHQGARMAVIKGITSIPDGAAAYSRGDAVRKIESFVDDNIAAALVGKLHVHFAMDDVKPPQLPPPRAPEVQGEITEPDFNS